MRDLAPMSVFINYHFIWATHLPNVGWECYTPFDSLPNISYTLLLPYYTITTPLTM
jgi:hypothetical protein